MANSIITNNGDGDFGDRLSWLPDAILVDILSLLPIKTSVSTSVLSRRWRQIWTQIIDLNLDSRDFQKVQTIEEISNFFAIVDNLLSLLTSPEIRKFKLHVRDPRCNPNPNRCDYWRSFCCYIHPWISQICGRKVKEIEVIADNYLDIAMLFPPCVFECQSLVSLNLGQGFDFRFPDEINLPNLRVLRVSLNDSHRELMGKLFRSCPLLEELSLLGTFSENDHFVDIIARNLKRLSIRMWVLHRRSIKVAIDAPRLEFFEVYDFVGVKFWFVKQPSASLELHVSGSGLPQEMSLTMELFNVISNVRSLKLHFSVISALSSWDDTGIMTSFNNLSSLTLSMHYPTYWKSLLGMLHCSPNLESLAINLVPGVTRMEVSLTPLDSPPACLLTCVRRMEIGLRGTEGEMDLVKYLLRNANVLERVVVKVIGESECKEVELQKELELYEELCKLPRSSLCCEISLCGSKLEQEFQDCIT